MDNEYHTLEKTSKTCSVCQYWRQANEIVGCCLDSETGDEETKPSDSCNGFTQNK